MDECQEYRPNHAHLQPITKYCIFLLKTRLLAIIPCQIVSKKHKKKKEKTINYRKNDQHRLKNKKMVKARSFRRTTSSLSYYFDSLRIFFLRNQIKHFSKIKLFVLELYYNERENNPKISSKNKEKENACSFLNSTSGILYYFDTVRSRTRRKKISNFQKIYYFA